MGFFQVNPWGGQSYLSWSQALWSYSFPGFLHARSCSPCTAAKADPNIHMVKGWTWWTWRSFPTLVVLWFYDSMIPQPILPCLSVQSPAAHLSSMASPPSISKHPLSALLEPPGLLCAHMSCFPSRSQGRSSPWAPEPLRLLPADWRIPHWLPFLTGWPAANTHSSVTHIVPEFLPVSSCLVLHPARGRAQYTPAAVSHKEQFHHLPLLAALSYERLSHPWQHSSPILSKDKA